MTNRATALGGIVVPSPDPTTLTTDQLHRELLSLREVIQARLDAMDKANELLNENVNRVPSDTDKQIAHLKSLHEEKFISVQRQFDERDTRAERESRDNKIAVDAAFAAAKEAVAAQNTSSTEAISKSEAATTKQIDQIGILIASTNKAVDDKINDIKEQLAQRSGGDHQRTVALQGSQFNVASVIGAVSALAAVVLVVILLATHGG